MTTTRLPSPFLQDRYESSARDLLAGRDSSDRMQALTLGRRPSDYVPKGTLRGAGVRGGRTHGECVVCGRPTERARRSNKFRKTCSEACHRASFSDELREQVLEQRRRQDAEGWAPEEPSGPRVAPPTCWVCSKACPGELPIGAKGWRDPDTGKVHLLSEPITADTLAWW